MSPATYGEWAGVPVPASTGSVRTRPVSNGRYVNIIEELLDLQEDATALGCESWLARLFPATSDADWLRTQLAATSNLR